MNNNVISFKTGSAIFERTIPITDTNEKGEEFLLYTIEVSISTIDAEEMASYAGKETTDKERQRCLDMFFSPKKMLEINALIADKSNGFTATDFGMIGRILIKELYSDAEKKRKQNQSMKNRQQRRKK